MQFRNLIIGLAIFFLSFLLAALSGDSPGGGKSEIKDGIMAEWKKLSPEEERVIVRKGTELPGTGEYLHTKQAGTYTCKRCGAPLYRSDDKFDSGCGWPAFDDEIAGAVKRVTNPGDSRIEILCNSCGGHLGHVFAGERLTDKNIRHCVNSISLQFVPKAQAKTEKAYFAAGCFWGVEHWFKTQPGVVRTRVGYMGGDLLNPSYRDVCSGDTGHAETLEVEFDPATTDFDTLARLFFEIHDFTQIDRQGPDIGPQYRSEIFTTSPEQDKAAENILDELRRKGYKPATKVTRAVTFWPAEEYHQDYYGKTGKMPYCHARREIFGIGARK